MGAGSAEGLNLKKLPKPNHLTQLLPKYIICEFDHLKVTITLKNVRWVSAKLSQKGGKGHSITAYAPLLQKTRVLFTNKRPRLLIAVLTRGEQTHERRQAGVNPMNADKQW